MYPCSRKAPSSPAFSFFSLVCFPYSQGSDLEGFSFTVSNWLAWEIPGGLMEHTSGCGVGRSHRHDFGCYIRSLVPSSGTLFPCSASQVNELSSLFRHPLPPWDFCLEPGWPVMEKVSNIWFSFVLVVTNDYKLFRVWLLDTWMYVFMEALLKYFAHFYCDF